MSFFQDNDRCASFPAATTAVKPAAPPPMTTMTGTMVFAICFFRHFQLTQSLHHSLSTAYRSP
jgi:hypothetical protein